MHAAAAIDTTAELKHCRDRQLGEPHLISTNWCACESSFADSFPLAGTVTALCVHRSRIAFGVPLTPRSAMVHVIVVALSPVLRRIAACRNGKNRPRQQWSASNQRAAARRAHRFRSERGGGACA